MLADTGVKPSPVNLSLLRCKATLCGISITGQMNPTHAATERVHDSLLHCQPQLSVLNFVGESRFTNDQASCRFA
jgi:hypothetical protein